MALALLLDIDGTLLETFEDILASMNEALQELGEQPLRAAELRPLIGVHVVQQLALLRRMHEAKAREVNERYYERFRQRVAKRVRPYPGVPRTLAELSLRPKVTFTTRRAAVARLMLATGGIDLYFQAIVGGDEVERQKPAPDLALHAAWALEAEPKDCVVVGDAPVDIQSGKAAGMRTVAVTYGYGRRKDLEAAGPDAFLDTFDGLPALLAKWERKG